MITAGEKRFLATTALEDFWDTSMPVVFLGDWCKRYSRRCAWEGLNSETMGSAWGGLKKIEDTYYYLSDTYEFVLSCLSSALNKIHGLSRGKEYWRIIIGMWLYYYIFTVYEKYSLIQEAFRRYPSLATIGLSESSFVVPRDTLDFVQYIKEDGYNLQLYTRLLKEAGLDFPRKAMAVAKKDFGSPKKEPRQKALFKNTLKRMWVAVERNFGKGEIIAIKNSYFTRSAQLKLILRCAGRVWTNNEGYLSLPDLPLDLNARQQLRDLPFGGGVFERLLAKVLPSDIPQGYVESFKVLKRRAAEKYPDKVKGIFTADSWCLDEAFKVWAAEAREAGALLLGSQHGGSYGSLAFSPLHDHEFLITDKFYSWGWQPQARENKIVPMPAPLLLGRKTLSASNKKKGILFGAGLLFRYFYLFPHFPEYFSGYLNWQHRFLCALPPELRADTRVRLHREEAGWDISDRLKESFPEVAIENWDTAFMRSIKDCRLFVCDNLLTTFIEALAANKPSILFWDPQKNFLLPQARPYYGSLTEAGILYAHPETAAEAVKTAYADIEGWWSEPQRQLAREQFCRRFARVSSDGLGVWAKEFKRVLDSGKGQK